MNMDSMMRLRPSPALPSIEPWRSEADIVITGRGRAFSSPATLSLILMMVILVGMTPFFDVDRIVSSTTGKIVATESVRTFQALDPSIIRTIDVKEGQKVEAGQQLATLDPTFAAADVGQLRQQIAGLDAQIRRAKAEQSHSTLDFPEPSSPEQALYMALQKDLFVQRAAQLHAQTQSFDEKINTTQASIDKIEADQALTGQREKIAHQVEGMRDTLYKSGDTSL
jgi:HlyD family secretion protein